MKTYIIAEAGVNHNGSADLARNLIDAAKTAGADAVKFQTFKTEKTLTRDTKLAPYQENNLGSSLSQFDMVKALELDFAVFEELKKYSDAVGIDFISTPDDDESLDFLVDNLDIKWVKIGSGEVSNIPFLKLVARKNRPIILSTGMSTLGEVEAAVRAIRSVSQQELVVLHCTTNYPCPPSEVNIRAMQTIGRALDVRIGYSDHTVGTEVSIAAVALGAEVIEKHLTLDKEMEGPDHKASQNPEEFAETCRQIRLVEQALGDGVKWPNPSEERMKPLVRRRIVSARLIAPGERITVKDLAFKRANNGVYAEHVEAVLGRTVSREISPDTPIKWEFLG